MKRHHRIHSGSTPYKCDLCGQSFRHYNSLTVHKRMHTGQRPYVCDICGRSYVLMSHLKAHRETHGGGKRRECDLCDMSYASANGLRRHKAKVHKGGKKCEYLEEVQEQEDIIIELPVEQVEYFTV
ncbi:hypothetical protein LOTGIDRAFT_129968 [Lottia gigantea]|uniref:C2H2-type domain-containing protein n=1 Tax=Lottia gigantea TaxID=225164 RepID=V4BAI5_LOTGI|nr:hypothetical protein LOTGIDRAFT_129968 [Lottia gigantea]ESO85969.1 hypothetical protein LOTGIDRAFT_129968 [Lottia gigantea]